MNLTRKQLINVISEVDHIPINLDKTKQWVKVRYEYSIVDENENGICLEVMLKDAWENFKERGYMYV